MKKIWHLSDDIDDTSCIVAPFQMTIANTGKLSIPGKSCKKSLSIASRHHLNCVGTTDSCLLFHLSISLESDSVNENHHP